MTTQPKKQNSLRRHILALIVLSLFSVSFIVPYLVLWNPVNTQEPYYPPSTSYTVIDTPSVSINSIAGESNFTRENWPVILDNYPDFSWKNPGRFNSTHTNAGVPLWPRVGTYVGYDYRTLPAPGTGAEQYPAIFKALEGLNESNIRIMYLDANYQWISVPYQIDQRGWANVWNIADLNKWGGMDTCDSSTIYSNGGSEHTAADVTVGTGWIAGDLVTSRDHSPGSWPGANYGGVSNDLTWDWYRLPTWTYVSKYQSDGSYTSEEVQIDPEYRDHLIWVTTMNSTRRPHMGWLEGDTAAGTNPHGNPWNREPGGTAFANQPNRNSAFRMGYHNITRDSYRECFINTTQVNPAGTTPQQKGDLWVDAAGHTNAMFIGDTWFTTPGDYATTAGGQALASDNWMRKAFPYKQIAGMLDKDDELVFYGYNGRKAPNYYWWNYSYFPFRFELAITDPVDGGQTYMYICFNNRTAYNFYKNATAANLGAPQFTTQLKDYVSWDPSTVTVTSDFYQISFKETNPTVLDGLRLFGNTDGQKILTQMQKMYIFGRIDQSLIAYDSRDTLPAAFKIGREGVWYSYSTGAPTSFSEMICTLDNPSVWYPGIVNDTSAKTVYRTYGGVTQYSPDRTHSNRVVPDGYYGLMGASLGLGPFLNYWEPVGDHRAIIDGPCRVIFYQQQFTTTGLYVHLYLSTGYVVDDDVDLALPLLDGPSFYYSRHQLGAEFSVAIPALSGFLIDIYYIYLMCGTFNNVIRNDFNLTMGREWSGSINMNIRTRGTLEFSFADQYGFTKIGGTDPKETDYYALGNSYPDGVSNDYYTSGGDPLLETSPVANTAVCPGDGTPLSGFPDWAMVTSQTHGGIWLYIPRREAMALKVNNFDPSLTPARAPGQPGQLKMFYRDDAYYAEFGICADGNGTGATPLWVRGGASTSKFHYMMVYGDFKPGMASQNMAHKLYVQYFFPLQTVGTFTADQGPGNTFVFGSVTPDSIIYKKGQTINIHVHGSHPTGTLTADFSAIDAGQTRTMTNNGDGSWDVSYTISNTNHPTPYAKIIKITATVPALEDAIYDLTVNIDDVAPTGAALANLPTSTSEPQVVLDWSANPGNDVGCASVDNPTGLSHYQIRRGTTLGVYNTILASNIPITQKQFVDTFVVNGVRYYYVIDTYDEVNNNATSAARNTLIALAFTPAQPNELPATIDAHISTHGITLDWTANPGYVAGGSISGYRVYRANSTSSAMPSANQFKLISGGTDITAKTYTDPANQFPTKYEAYYYFYKVQSHSGTNYANSSIVMTRLDRVAPAAAELATPLPIYISLENQIIVSWSIDTLPQYQTAGFPGQDLNGIDHWVIYRNTTAKAPFQWSVVATVPYGPNPEDQLLEDINVVNKTNYRYRIGTYDAAGNYANCTYDKWTTLYVKGSGFAEVTSVIAGADEVTQNQKQVTVTIDVRNPGGTDVTITQAYLTFKKNGVDVSSNYVGRSKTGLSQILGKLGGTWTTTFTVNVSVGAQLGTIEITSTVVYTPGPKSATGGPDSWTVKPDADLIIQTVTSTYTIVRPGQQNIPVQVTVKNPGSLNATVTAVQLTFTRSGVDISNEFLVATTGLPTALFTGNKIVDLTVTPSVTVTAGPVVVDAIVSGSASGVPLGDEGAVTPLQWAVASSAMPIIVSVSADSPVYWDAPNDNTIALSVVCDTASHTVDGWFKPVQSTAGWVTGTLTTGTTYVVTYTLTGGHATEGFYNLMVRATNATGSTTSNITVHLGDAPTFSGLSQTPGTGEASAYEAVIISLQITDTSGPATVNATLYYRVNGADWNTVPMTFTPTNNWAANIPGQKGGTAIEYYIYATDATGLSSETSETSFNVKIMLLLPGTKTIKDPLYPTRVINETVGYGAKIGDSIQYSITIDPSSITIAKNYVVIVSAFDPARDCFIDINTSVYLSSTTPLTKVALDLIYTSGIVQNNDMVQGKIFLLTDFPKNGGQTLQTIPFLHRVQLT